jgi:hypothetical protein
MIIWRAGTGRRVTDDYLESWDRQDRYRLLPGELGQVGQGQVTTWRAGTGRTGTGYYLESWDRQDGYR